MAKKKYSKYGTKARGSYKSDNTYLNAVYKANKDFIDSKQQDIGKGKKSDRDIFKQIVLEYKETHNTSIVKAVGMALSSRTYQTKEEMYKRNVVKALKKAGLHSQFRELTKERGRYTKFDETKLKFSGKDSVSEYDSYVYDNKVIIMFTHDYKTGQKNITLIPI